MLHLRVMKMYQINSFIIKHNKITNSPLQSIRKQLINNQSINPVIDFIYTEKTNFFFTLNCA